MLSHVRQTSMGHQFICKNSPDDLPYFIHQYDMVDGLCKCRWFCDHPEKVTSEEIAGKKVQGHKCHQENFLSVTHDEKGIGWW